MLKRNNRYIPRINNGSTHIYKAYRGATLVFGIDKREPCFAVVDDISTYTDRTWVDIYDKKTKKWYKLNNLNEYEVYGIMSVVNSLADATYYVGKMVICDGKQYKWNGTEWEILVELDYVNPDTDPNEYFIIPYKDNIKTLSIRFKTHWGNNYKVAIDCKIIGDYSRKEGGQFLAYHTNNNIPVAPIEFNAYSNGFYYDFHAPQSTTEPKCYNGDYTKRKIEMNLSSIPKDGTRIIASIDGSYVEFKRYDTGASLYKVAHNMPQNYDWYDGNYWQYFGTNKDFKVCQSGCKIYDNNNNLIHDVVVRYDPMGDAFTKVYLLDRITNERFYTYSESPDFHVETANGSELPSAPQNIVQYDQKVAPSDNVVYDTLEELEMMECPWYGMKAIVGGKKYEYTKDGWDEMTQYIEFNLNGQWVESTKKLDGYDVFESNSNYHKDNSFASMQVKWLGYPDFSLYINSYGERSFDYTVAWQMDKDAPTSLPAYNSSGVVGHTYQKSANPTSISDYTLVSYPNDGGEHFAWITYRKDSVASEFDDRGRIAVKKDIYINTEWRIVQDAYSGSSGVYYEVLEKYATSDGINWVNLGIRKQGKNRLQTVDRLEANEYLISESGTIGTTNYSLKAYQKVYVDVITPDGVQRSTSYYKQGSQLSTFTQDDGGFVIVGSKKYHRLDIYVIIDDTNKVKTDYYEVGDFIEDVELTLPDNCILNYNAKNMLGNKLLKDNNVQYQYDAEILNMQDSDYHGDYVTLKNNTNNFAVLRNSSTYLNRDSNNPELTIIVKALTTSSYGNIIVNRAHTYNWMYRQYNDHASFHGTQEVGNLSFANDGNPQIISVVVNANKVLKITSHTEGNSINYNAFSYGDLNYADGALFRGFSDKEDEPWGGNFYWVCVYKRALSADEIEQVINYNENY